MLSIQSLIRQHGARLVAPTLFCALGCATPRAQYNNSWAARPSQSGVTASRAANATATTTTRPAYGAIPRSSRLAAPTTARGTNLTNQYNRDLGPRAAPSLERDVARFVAQPSQVFRPVWADRDWQYIVLHHSGAENGGLASIDRYHREVNKWDECGYHFVIGNGTESGDGEIEVGTRWPKQKHGAHTKPGNNNEYNERGIGICLIGNFNNAAPTPKQLEATRRLVAYLRARYDLPASAVFTHGDVVGTHTECPGANFPLDRILSNSGFAAR